MKNRDPERRIPAARLDGVLFELFVEGGHGNRTSGEIYGSVDRESTE
jgi:hypothetical protein